MVEGRGLWPRDVDVFLAKRYGEVLRLSIKDAARAIGTTVSRGLSVSSKGPLGGRRGRVASS